MPSLACKLLFLLRVAVFYASVMKKPFRYKQLCLILITGAQLGWGTGLKMQAVSFFQRYIVRDISLT